MKNYFHFSMSLVFWLLMIVGFSDNWLFDIRQPSNTDPKYLVHAFFGFCWFTLLMVQSGFVRRDRVKTHMALGIAGIAIFAGFVATTSFIYVFRLIYEGTPEPLAILNMSLFAFAIVLISHGLLIRKTNSESHKNSIVFGSFFLMEPGISRTVNHLFGNGSESIWLLIYLVFFALFAWQLNRFRWQVGLGFVIWLVGTINIVANMP